jgi:hypothetical protein
MKPIHFSASIGRPGGDEAVDEVFNNEQLVNTVSIRAVGDDRALNGTNGNVATNAIGIIKLGQASLVKTLEEPVVDLEEQIVYNVRHQNLSTTMDYTGYKLLDVLPYDGDDRGSDFDGTYTVSLEISFPQYTSGKTVVNIHKLTGNTWRGKSAKDVDAGTLPAAIQTVSGGGSTTTVDLGGDAAAICVTGTLVAGDTYRMRVILTPANNRSGNIYFNNATAITNAGGTEEVLAPEVAAVVVYRTISGLAWEDSDKDGIRQNSEPALPNVKVSLYDKAASQPAKDVYNQTVPPVTTGADGTYRFTDLPQGVFYVVFEGTGGFVIGNYGVTLKHAGDTRLDSDVSGVYSGDTLTGAQSGDRTMPAKAAVGPNGFHAENVDAGFTSDPPPPRDRNSPR